MAGSLWVLPGNPGCGNDGINWYRNFFLVRGSFGGGDVSLHIWFGYISHKDTGVMGMHHLSALESLLSAPFYRKTEVRG